MKRGMPKRSWNLGPPHGLFPRVFLSRHWQRRPLLLRGAFPDLGDPITPARLVALACRKDVESRLVLEKGGARPWQVIHGPQDARRLSLLPPAHWTLLVQDVDKHVPAVAALRDAFHFLPRWRIDDVMVSLAPSSGSVGAHQDSYDVFLLQGRGRRRWRIGHAASPELRPGLELPILRRFVPEQEVVLESGDMLYLPPGVAHHGVALDDCLTYSIGLRAPSPADLVVRHLQRLLERLDRSILYRDPRLRADGEPGAIGRESVALLGRMLTGACAPPRGLGLDHFVGELLTEPKRLALRPRRPKLSSSGITGALRRAGGLVPAPDSRLAFIRRGPRQVLLFVDGRCLPMPAALAFAAPLLSDPRGQSAGQLRPLLRRPGFRELLTELVNAGALRLARPRRPRASGREEATRS